MKQFPKSFNPLTDALPAGDQQFDRAIAAVKNKDEEALLQACHAIEAYFGFPADEQVKNAEIPGGMYTNMVAQLKQFNPGDAARGDEHPSVRRDAGLPPGDAHQPIGGRGELGWSKKCRPKSRIKPVRGVGWGEYGKTPVPRPRVPAPNRRYREVEEDTSTYKRKITGQRSTAVHVGQR